MLQQQLCAQQHQPQQQQQQQQEQKQQPQDQAVDDAEQVTKIVQKSNWHLHEEEEEQFNNAIVEQVDAQNVQLSCTTYADEHEITGTRITAELHMPPEQHVAVTSIDMQSGLANERPDYFVCKNIRKSCTKLINNAKAQETNVKFMLNCRNAQNDNVASSMLPSQAQHTIQQQSLQQQQQKQEHQQQQKQIEFALPDNLHNCKLNIKIINNNINSDMQHHQRHHDQMLPTLPMSMPSSSTSPPPPPIVVNSNNNNNNSNNNNLAMQTLDFNRRRRRGRLRSFNFGHYVDMIVAAIVATTTILTAKLCQFIVNAANKITTIYACMPATLLQQHHQIKTVAATKIKLLMKQTAIYRYTIEFALLLLSFLIDFVHIGKQLVLSVIKCCSQHCQQQRERQHKCQHTTTTMQENSSNVNALENVKKSKKQLKTLNNIEKEEEEEGEEKIMPTNATTFDPHDMCNNNKNKYNTNITSNNITNNNNNQTKFHYDSQQQRKMNKNNSNNNKNNMQFIYTVMLCTSILLLPCSQNLVAAAKPKSATQLQQQQKQQQQQHQHQHQAQQPAPDVSFASVANGKGGILTPPPYQVISSQTSNEETEFSYPSSQSEEQLFDEEEQNLNDLDEEEDNAAYETHRNNETHNENVTISKTPLFPKDLFTKEQLENGAVICHIMGVIYMFVALAIVCDEFFVPSLDVIIEKLDITDDVAGATFMAAGGSAPELFTSVIGVFISFDDVGIGTIVGSAVFNILFVIGMCALFSKTVLTLTWWPLFRDCTFYSISLLVLIYFFRDNFIYWWEALILFSIYAAYVAFMKWNVQVERCVKKVITKNKGNAANSSETSMATQPGGSVTSRAASETRSGPPGSSSGAGATGNSSGGNAGSTHTGAKFRHGLLQLMIHTIDPLHDDDVPGKVDEKATQLHAIASLKVLLDATKPQRGGATTSAANHVKINLKETTLADRPNGNIDTTLDSPSLSGRRPSWIEQRVKIQTRKFSIKTNEIEEEPEPLSMAWPDTARKRFTYILVAPLLIPMWLTLPDTRTPRGKKYFPITFIGSILWIAAFSYLMVWWANVAGDTARIPPEVMGLTFLAAGTSIPDLITSVIVARKGFGDMAVSSSVGSNIFDVTVGLPIPWLLFGIIYDAPVEVNSVGMVCSITILFMMLLFVVMSIACFRWRMNKGLGFTMFLLYFVFVAVSLMFEYDLITCPV